MAEDFREFKVKNVLVKYFKTVSPFESQTEVHLYFNDLYLVLKGSAVVWVSEDFSGGDEKEKGEIRNCSMHTYDTIGIKEGDVLLIPAGTAHRLIVSSGNFEQIVLKVKE